MIDMHIHTVHSDGEYTVKEILKKCSDTNISVMSITDHNDLEGSKELLEIKNYPNIRKISGIELSATAPKGTEKHILGYNFDVI